MENDKLVRLSDVERWILTEAACIDTPADRDAVVERMRYSLPAVDYVPMDFHDRCMQTEIRKRHDLERFVKWVMDEIFSADWEEYRIAFDELACRKLVKLGYVAVDEENDLYYRKDEPEDE